MSKPFMNEDFLLSGETARELYHDHAARMPIIDYHCHIDPRQIYEDKPFEDLAQAWPQRNGKYPLSYQLFHGIIERD